MITQMNETEYSDAPIHEDERQPWRRCIPFRSDEDLFFGIASAIVRSKQQSITRIIDDGS